MILFLCALFLVYATIHASMMIREILTTGDEGGHFTHTMTALFGAYVLIWLSFLIT